MNEKTITFKIQEQLHKELKVLVATNGGTIKDYIITLIKNDLKGVSEDVGESK